MDWKKIAPWNWFEEEEQIGPRAAPSARIAPSQDPIVAMRIEMDRLFDDAVRRSYPHGPHGFSLTRPVGRDDSRFASLRPRVDISEGSKAYAVRVELPGIEPDDVSLEVEGGNTLIIRAEKRQDREEEDEGYHWVESSYGVAQRILSLPDDADADAVQAKFKNGVLKLSTPKHPVRVSKRRSIDVPNAKG
ncbi:MAG: Hsp20/alpha crystallin family protein [Deltaproteobacteria bacterium]|nr:Hsp20/alpha crystallin family protein [Deltaproteobacteria bacterium]